VPRRPKFTNPLRVVRDALGMSQPQFAGILGISASYLQAIELGQRDLRDDLADEIMLRYGVDAESVKRKRGMPRHLIGSNAAHYTLLTASSKSWMPAESRRVVYHGLRIPRVIRDRLEEYRALWKPKNERERLRRMILFWKEKIVPAWQSDQSRVRDVLNNKVGLLFEAAERENKYYSVAARLSRWIDKVVRECQLRTTIDAVSMSRTGRQTEWPTFMQTLSKSFGLTPHPRQRPEEPACLRKPSRRRRRR
jgi:transcriptional regulator with XRE-family HTH domain